MASEVSDLTRLLADSNKIRSTPGRIPDFTCCKTRTVGCDADWSVYTVMHLETLEQQNIPPGLKHSFLMRVL